MSYDIVFANPPAAGRTRRGALASLPYTLEYEPEEGAGYDIDVQLFYEWEDYDPADEPFAAWGAQVVGLEVLGVIVIDPAETPPAVTDWAALAWRLVDQQRDGIEEQCTRAGIQADVGRASPLASLRLAPAGESMAPPQWPALAPSARTRGQQAKLKFG